MVGQRPTKYILQVIMLRPQNVSSRIFHSRHYHCTVLVFFAADGRMPTRGSTSQSLSSLSSISSSSETTAVSSMSLVRELEGDSGAASASRGRRTRGPKHCSESGGPSARYKTSRKPVFDVKVKRRAPWGMQQLRDSWSVDAMTKGDKDNMSERIHREYRYHPDEFRRHHIKVAAFMIIPAVVLGAFVSYYCHTGRPLWEGDSQYVLNVIRQMDTSPRSKLHAYRLEGMEELPAHLKAYREKHWKRRLALDNCILPERGEEEKEERGDVA